MRNWIIIAGLLLTVHSLAPAARAQDLIELYRAERVKAQAAELARRHGIALTPRPPEHLWIPSDSLFAEKAAPAADSVAAPADPPNPFATARWNSVHHFAQSWFDERYAGVRWAYLGNVRLSPLDTTLTTHLRARLEAAFERPTRTLLDVMREQQGEPEEYIQFEYDFIVNDSIPVLVMDTAGPFDRGVVIATDEQYRPYLQQLREGLATQIFGGKPPAAYTDYYFDPEPRIWYLTGYDGIRYFTQRVKQPNFVRWSRPDIQRPPATAKRRGTK